MYLQWSKRLGPKIRKGCKTTDCDVWNGCYDCKPNKPYKALRSSPTNANNNSHEIFFTHNRTIINRQTRGKYPYGLQKPCKFPFAFKGRTFLGCTNWCPNPCENILNYCKPNYWCATEVDSTNYMTEWGWCYIDWNICPLCRNSHCESQTGKFCEWEWEWRLKNQTLNIPNFRGLNFKHMQTSPRTKQFTNIELFVPTLFHL